MQPEQVADGLFVFDDKDRSAHVGHGDYKGEGM
jgi:hypothetical protein